MAVQCLRGAAATQLAKHSHPPLDLGCTARARRLHYCVHSREPIAFAPTVSISISALTAKSNFIHFIPQIAAPLFSCVTLRKLLGVSC